MQWVETTAKTVTQAKDLALDRLGVDEADAEFEILEEPRPGLFGRVRGEARVRARVRPVAPRPKLERRRGRKSVGSAASAASSDGGSDRTVATADVTNRPPAQRKPASPRAKQAKASPAGSTSTRQETRMSDNDHPERESALDSRRGPGADTADGSLVDESQAATEFLTGLMDAFALQASVSVVDIDSDELEARVDGDDLGVLIGPRGQTLQSLQEVTRLAVQQRRGGVRGGWLRVDVSGYRAKRRDALIRFTNKVAGEVLASGESRALEPMAAADRKIVHDAASELAGVATTSEGEEPHRRVVIRPANA